MQDESDFFVGKVKMKNKIWMFYLCTHLLTWCYGVLTYLNYDSMEAVWLDILLAKRKPILLGALYRPPDQSDFHEILENVCTAYCDFLNSEVILLGYVNTHVLNMSCSLYKALSNICLTHLINEPTRICVRLPLISLWYQKITRYPKVV